MRAAIVRSSLAAAILTLALSGCVYAPPPAAYAPPGYAYTAPAYYPAPYYYYPPAYGPYYYPPATGSVGIFVGGRAHFR